MRPSRQDVFFSDLLRAGLMFMPAMLFLHPTVRIMIDAAIRLLSEYADQLLWRMLHGGF